MTDQMINIDGITELQDALADLADHASDDLADHLADHAFTEESRVRARANSVGGVARLAAKSVRARTAKAGGTISGGGGGKLPNGTGTYGDIFMGSEFGGGSRPQTRQFQPYRSRGYWFFNQLDKDEEQLDEQLLDEITDRLES